MDKSELIFLLRRRFSSAFRSNSPESGRFSAPYGSGFNGEIEIGWQKLSENEHSTVEHHFSGLIKLIDHRHLGMDAPELKITTPESLLQFCGEFFASVGFRPSIIRLRRGEDITYEASRRS